MKTQFSSILNNIAWSISLKLYTNGKTDSKKNCSLFLHCTTLHTHSPWNISHIALRLAFCSRCPFSVIYLHLVLLLQLLMTGGGREKREHITKVSPPGMRLQLHHSLSFSLTAAVLNRRPHYFKSDEICLTRKLTHFTFMMYFPPKPVWLRKKETYAKTQNNATLTQSACERLNSHLSSQHAIHIK